MATDRNPSDFNLSIDPVVQEARKRFDRISEWEATFRERFLEDLKFRHGDSHNGYQWPNSIRKSRDGLRKPCLTMNIVRQHNLLIANDLRKNKVEPKIKGKGGGATQESAKIMQDLVRDVISQSAAQTAFTIAREFMIDAGLGYIRLTTEYANNDSNDQVVRIVQVQDPLSVYLDPDIETKDGSDSRYALIFDEIPKHEFDDSYPKFAGKGTPFPLGIGSIEDNFVTKDTVRIVEYFKKDKKPDQLVSFILDGERRVIRKSLLKGKMLEVLDDSKTQTRDIEDEIIKWYLIVNEEIIDETTWLGKYIPIVRIIGEETKIGGVLDRKGHTRAMVDAQRMFNYNASAEVEFVALQGKTPWTGAIASIEGYETYWNTANTENHSFLGYKHIDEDGNPIPPEALPRRIDPPNVAPGYMQGMETAFNQMMMVSGQYQNQLGMQGNERTGAAINSRQAQSDTAVYHFQDNYEEGLVFLARQLIDLFPKIYNTKQVMHLIAGDGEEYELEIDPGAKQAYVQQLAYTGEKVKKVFNPQIGQYEVEPSFGPAYGTKREETVQALALILTQSPGLSSIIGDLLLSSMDFDKAQEAAQRLKRMVPPQALGVGPNQNEQQLMQSVQALQAALAKSMQAQGRDKLKLVGKEEKRDIDVYAAETDRIKALAALLPTNPEVEGKLISQLGEDASAASLRPILETNQEDLGQTPIQQPDMPPVPGAQKSSDGYWYATDPTRKGKYLKFEPLNMLRGAMR